MATIPMGPGRRVMPQRAPMVQVADLSAPAEAVTRAGAIGVQIGLQRVAEQEREAEIERRRQEATREAAERARDDVHLQTVEDQLKGLHDEIGGQVLRGEVAKDQAEKVWAERAQKLVSDGATGFSEFGRQIAEPRLVRTVLQLGRSVRQTVEKKDREDVSADMLTRLERLQRDYMVDPVRAEKEAGALFDTLGPFSKYAPTELAGMRQRWKEGAQYAAADAAIRAGRNDPKALAEAEKVLAGLQDIDPKQRVVLEDRIASYRFGQEQRREMLAQRAAREAEARMRKAEAEFNTFQALADKGTVLAPEFVDRTLAATAGTPYQAGVRALAQQAREAGGLAAQPIAAQRQLLDAIDAEIATKGRSPALDKRRDQVAKVLQGAEADLERDGLRAGLERGLVTEITPLNLTAGIDSVAPQIQQRVADAQRVGQWAGGAVSPLTGEEAAQLGRMLAASPADQRAVVLASIAAVVPPEQGQAIARQIDKQDRALALALAAGTATTTQGRTTAELILRGAQAVKDKAIKEDTAAESGLRASLAKELGDAVPEAARRDITDAARLIFLGKQAAGERISPAGAVRLAIGGDIVERANGQRVPVPAGVDLEQRLMQYPESRITQQAPDGFVYLPGGRPMGVPEFLAALPGAQLEPAGLGRYFVRSGGSLVINRERRPIVVDVR